MAKKQQIPDDEPTYRSGAVARLSGIPVETLRVWERRYGVVGPRQSPKGQRLYSPGDVTRLTVIKQLVDSGHAIGSVASLQLERLQSMLNSAIDAAARATQPNGTPGVVAPVLWRVVVVGEALALRVAQLDPARFRIVAVEPNVSQALQHVPALSADLLLIEAPTLPSGSPQRMRLLAEKAGAQHVVVECGFGTSRSRRDLQARGYHVLPAPLGRMDIESLFNVPVVPRAVGLHVAPASTSSISPPRFDNKMLAEVSLAAVALKCECPHHLSDLLLRLGNFETYSAECKNDSPSDAALHEYLKKVAGTARLLLEAALIRVAEIEGIALR